MSYSHETYDSDLSYMECAKIEIIEKDEELFEFFKKLKGTYDELSIEDTAPKMEEKQVLEKEREEIEKEVREATEKLSKRMKVQAYNRQYTYYDDLYLTKDILEGKKEAPFRNEYETKRNKNNEEFSEKEENLPKEIEKLTRKIKFFPWRKEQYKLELDSKNAELDKIKKERADEKNLFEKAERYESLSDEDKKEILHHIELLSKSGDIFDKIKRKEYEILSIKQAVTLETISSNNKITDIEMRDDRYSRAFGRMLNNGEITEEDLDKIFRKFDKIGIKGRRGEYETSYPASITDKFREIKEATEWFIEKVYEADEKFIERNTEVEIEEEKKTTDDLDRW